MMYHILVVCMFLISGQPIAVAGVSEMCDEDAALAMAHIAKDKIGGDFQDEILWDCLDVTSPGPVLLAPQRGAKE